MEIARFKLEIIKFNYPVSQWEIIKMQQLLHFYIWIVKKE